MLYGSQRLYQPKSVANHTLRLYFDAVMEPIINGDLKHHGNWMLFRLLCLDIFLVGEL